MSEETLRRFLERLNGDAAFRETVQQDAAGAFAEFGLSPTEQTALASNDEDALRRLAGADVQGYLLNVGGLLPQLPLLPDAQGGPVSSGGCRPPNTQVNCASSACATHPLGSCDI